METLKIKHFMPTERMYKDMVEHEVTYFHRHNNTRFKIASRLIPRKGTWVHFFRAAPYLYQWTKVEAEILPDHYKRRCKEFMTTEPLRIHWRPDTRRYLVDEDSGAKTPVVNAPIPVLFPKQCNVGLWGGEGIIFGYYKKTDPKRKTKLPTYPRIWRPMVKKQVLYSEILDCYMSIPITPRTLYLVDEAFGLDNYILQTHEVDLCSRLGMTLKREMLLALARKSMYPDDPIKRDKIYNKYKDFVIPEEEAEWIGLEVFEAVEKAQEQIDEANKPRPLKDSYLVALIKQLGLDDVPVPAKSKAS